MSDKEPFRIAVISDSQAYPESCDWGMNNLEKSLRSLAEKRPDVVINCGDIADRTIFGVFDKYREIYEKAFDPLPKHIICAGNHDYWKYAGTEMDAESIYREICRRTGITAENPRHEIIGGYDFITLSENISPAGGYSKNMLGALENEIRKAVARDAGKPVFVITHYHPANTVAGSIKGGTTGLRDIFNKYPSVFSISGHSHCPLRDERCLWQGEFTAVNSSSLAYGCEEDACYNMCSVIIPFARESANFMLLELFADHCDIHRYNAHDGKEIAADKLWQLPLPCIQGQTKYGDDRKNFREAPVFPSSAEAVIRYDFGYLYAIFDPAEHEYFTHFYEIKIYGENSAEPVACERYISDFYRLEQFSEGKQVFKLPGDKIIPGKKYRIEIYPVETFGNVGPPLIIERKMPEADKFLNGSAVCPQE